MKYSATKQIALLRDLRRKCAFCYREGGMDMFADMVTEPMSDRIIPDSPHNATWLVSR